MQQILGPPPAPTALSELREHRRDYGHQDVRQCVVCHERHPCEPWRRARAEVLVLLRQAFQAARAGEPL